MKFVSPMQHAGVLAQVSFVLRLATSRYAARAALLSGAWIVSRGTSPQGSLRDAAPMALDKLAGVRGEMALQAYLGHRNIQHTVRYTESSPGRFKDFWR